MEAYESFSARRLQTKEKEISQRQKNFCDWIESVLEIQLGKDPLESIKDGVILSRLINRIQPGSLKEPSPTTMSFKKMDNVQRFITSCKNFGVPTASLFLPNDLVRNDNISKFLDCMEALSSLAEQKGFTPKMKIDSSATIPQSKGSLPRVQESTFHKAALKDSRRSLSSSHRSDPIDDHTKSEEISSKIPEETRFSTISFARRHSFST